WAASLAARRWGHAVSGYLGGLPLIGGPVTFFLALDPGPAFSATSPIMTPGAVSGPGAHQLPLAPRGAATGRGGVARPAGVGGCGGVALVIPGLRLGPVPALALAAAGLAIGWFLMPPIRGTTTLPAVPTLELWLRLGAALCSQS